MSQMLLCDVYPPQISQITPITSSLLLFCKGLMGADILQHRLRVLFSRCEDSMSVGAALVKAGARRGCAYDGRTQTSRRHPQSEHILRGDASALAPQVFLGDGPAVHLAPARLKPLQNAASSLAVALGGRRGAAAAAGDALGNRRVAAGFGSAHCRFLTANLGLT